MTTSSNRRPARGGKIKGPKRVGLEIPIEEMWNRLANAIGHIQNHNIGSLSYEEHYRYAYNLVLYNHGDLLYSGVRKLIEQHLSKKCSEAIVVSFPPGGTSYNTPGIVLPEQVITKRQQRAIVRVNDAAQQDWPPNSDQSATHQDESTPEGPSISTTQSGDRTDAVAIAQANERLLKAIRDTWDDHCACMSKLRDILKYVDRVYVEQTRHLPVWDLGLELFRDTILRSVQYPVHTHLYRAILTQIQLEREGSVINRSTLKSNIEMLSLLTHAQQGVSLSARPTVYQHDFEPAFLATSEEFYKAEAERLLDMHDAAHYLRHVERRFVEEETRVTIYLSSATDKPLSRIIERTLLTTHLQSVIDMPGSSIVTMLDEERREDLARLYRLFWRVSEGPAVLKTALKNYIASQGRQINDAVKVGAKLPTLQTDANGESNKNVSATALSPQAQPALKWVEDVLAFKTKFDGILHSSFQSDKGCETSINEAFETFVNLNPRSPECISLFIDENLKKGLKGKTEEEVEEVLRQTITVFRFLHEKDVFERYYKGHLAKRLLQGRSVSDDAERAMMAKLKIECGHGYVHKLQGMFNDMKTSDDTMFAFQESLDATQLSMPFELSTNVLTSTFWPISAQAPPCIMPHSMNEARSTFERFYQSRHSGRLLTWHPNYGTADVRVQFRTRKHELNVSTYALVVLLLFEDLADDESLTFIKIQEMTSISDSDLGRTLQSLACAKYKILLKEPKGRDVHKTDKFSFNTNFQCNLARIKIAQVAARVENATERKETTEKIEEERKNQVEACLVRIMKNRKTMSHNELVNEVIRQLSSRFQPSPVLIKRRIESLIDREYLERNDSSMNIYHYQA